MIRSRYVSKSVDPSEGVPLGIKDKDSVERSWRLSISSYEHDPAELEFKVEYLKVR